VKKDLTFIHFGNDSRVSGLVNFEKLRMIAKEVCQVTAMYRCETASRSPSTTVSLRRGLTAFFVQKLVLMVPSCYTAAHIRLFSALWLKG